MVNPKLAAIIQAVIDTAPPSMGYAAAEALNALAAYDEGAKQTTATVYPHNLSREALDFIAEHVKSAEPAEPDEPASKVGYDHKVCPHCGANGSTYWPGRDGNGGIFGSAANPARACCACDATWDDTYEITGYTNLVAPPEDDEYAS